MTPMNTTMAKTVVSAACKCVHGCEHVSMPTEACSRSWVGHHQDPVQPHAESRRQKGHSPHHGRPSKDRAPAQRGECCWQGSPTCRSAEAQQAAPHVGPLLDHHGMQAQHSQHGPCPPLPMHQPGSMRAQLNEDGTPMDRQAEVQALIQEQLQRSRGASSRAPPLFTDPSRPGRAPMSEVRLLVAALTAAACVLYEAWRAFWVLSVARTSKPSHRALWGCLQMGGRRRGGLYTAVLEVDEICWALPQCTFLAGQIGPGRRFSIRASQVCGKPALLAAGAKAWLK